VSLLTRHILIELLKVMLLTCSVLVVVIAFGAAVRPLADNLLGPVDMLKYIGLATVPMLQFALPFAAGFAATMVMHRMVTDNELLAMSVSGLSYRRIFTPVGWLGVFLAVAMLLLVNFAVPRFWMAMRATVTRDVTRLFVNRISQGSAFEAGGLQIFADAVVQDEPAPDSDAIGRMRMAGLAAVQLDAAGRPSTEFTAELATVDIYRDESGTYLKPSLVNATVYRDDDGTLAYMPRAVPDAVRLSDPARVTPKFMTFPQIMQLRGDPERYPSVRESRLRLERTLREEAMWRYVSELFESGRALNVRDPLDRASYVIEAGRIVERRLLPTEGGVVRITELVGGTVTRIVDAPEATILAIPIGHDGQGLSLDLLVENATVRVIGADGASGASSSRRWPPRIASLRFAGEPGSDLHLLSLAEIRERAKRLELVAGPVSELHIRIDRQLTEIADGEMEVDHEIKARLNQRVAVTFATPLVLLLGATLASWRRNAAPLAIYAVAFVPSIADILLIAGGEQMMKDGRIFGGLVVMWSGNVFMATFVVAAWTRLRRN